MANKYFENLKMNSLLIDYYDICLYKTTINVYNCAQLTLIYFAI